MPADRDQRVGWGRARTGWLGAGSRRAGLQRWNFAGRAPPVAPASGSRSVPADRDQRVEWGRARTGWLGGGRRAENRWRDPAGRGRSSRRRSASVHRDGWFGIGSGTADGPTAGARGSGAAGANSRGPVPGEEQRGRGRPAGPPDYSADRRQRFGIRGRRPLAEIGGSRPAGGISGAGLGSRGPPAADRRARDTAVGLRGSVRRSAGRRSVSARRDEWFGIGSGTADGSMAGACGSGVAETNSPGPAPARSSGAEVGRPASRTAPPVGVSDSGSGAGVRPGSAVRDRGRGPSVGVGGSGSGAGVRRSASAVRELPAGSAEPGRGVGGRRTGSAGRGQTRAACSRGRRSSSVAARRRRTDLHQRTIGEAMAMEE